MQNYFLSKSDTYLNSELIPNHYETWALIFVSFVIPINSIALSNVAILFWALSGLVVFFWKEKSILPFKANVLLYVTPLFLYILNVLSLFSCVSLDCKNLNFNFLERHLFFLAYPLLLLFTQRLSENDARVVINWMGLSLLVQLILIVSLKGYSPVDHPYLGMFSAFSCLTSLLVFFKERSFPHLIMGAMMIALLILLNAKNALVVTAIMLLIILFLYRKVYLIVSLLAIVILGLIVLWQSDLLNLLSQYGKAIIYIKTFSWRCSWQAFTAAGNYWIGVGIGNSEEALAKVYHTYPDWIAYMGYNSHNQYLETLLASGILGLLLLILWFGLIIREAISRNIMNLLFLVVIFMLASITESTLWRQKGILFLVFFSIILIKMKRTAINHN
ncbi:MAG: O-antigen ligase family protein [Chryseotalea sp. WA131a]|jgi:O-antigen ligase|nr:MAG: O-antigen ligase family protein [Chryseotalea sp. WA131a]